MRATEPPVIAAAVRGPRIEEMLTSDPRLDGWSRWRAGVPTVIQRAFGDRSSRWELAVRRMRGTPDLARLRLEGDDARYMSPPEPDKAIPTFREVSVDELLLDPQNPRLPEGLVPARSGVVAVQEAILEYFRVHGNLDELAQSFVDNGYFKTEPMIVTKEDAPSGHLLVLEGNRRLAALRMVLAGSAAQREQLDIEVDAALRRTLKRVPVLEVLRRADATAMIGFRHIGGLKFWDSEAKARWIAHQVENASSEPDPFGHVARMVGMPRAQIRYYYLAAGLVRVARKEVKYDTGKLTAQDRFGVFLRGIENPGIRAFIGLDEVSEYAEARRAIEAARKQTKNLARVLDDIASADANGKFLVGDSRNIAKYGQILGHPEALAALRKESFEAAVAVLAPITLAEDVRRTVKQLQRLRDKLDVADTLSDEIIEDVHGIQKIAKRLRASNN